MIDHDRLFKELLTTFFYEFLELFQPEIAAYIDRDSIEFLDKEIFTDVTSGKKYEADIVAKAKIRDEEAFVLLHLENQSYIQSEFARRMLRYFTRLFDKYDLRIYPIALFSFDEPNRIEPNTYSVDFPNKRVLHFDFEVISLSRLDWRDFLTRPNPVASALMAKMQIAPEDRPLVKAECLRMMVNLPLDEARTQLLSGFVDMYLVLDAIEETVFQEAVADFAPHEEEQAMQIITSWMRTGIEQGLKRGRAEGRDEGRKEGRKEGREEAFEWFREFVQQQWVEEGREATLKATLLRLLTKRFGELPEQTEVQIRRLNQKQLENLTDAVLDFQQVSDLEAWLQAASETQN